MRALGIGNDIIEIERIRKSLQKHGQRFLDKLFTKTEQTYCQRHADPVPSYAGRFAAKEAVVKALGTGFNGQIGWLDIEIINDEAGKPEVWIQSEPAEILVSISHCKAYATAVAIAF